MTKRTLLFLCCVLLFSVSVPKISWGQNSKTQRKLVENVDYTLSNNKKALTSYKAKDLTTLDMMQDEKLAAITEISEQAFENHIELSAITLPKNLVRIRNYAFSGVGITQISLPETVATLGGGSNPSNVFEGCPYLKEIKLEGQNANFAVVDGVLFTKDKTRLIAYPSAKSGDNYRLPEGVKVIGTSSVAYAKLNEFTCSPSLLTIESFAFESSSIAHLVLNDGIEFIQPRAFLGMDKLEEILLPSSLRIVKNGTVYHNPLYGATSLKRILLSHGSPFLEVEGNALYTKGKKVLLALAPADNETTEYKTPATVTEIAEGAFAYNQHIKRVVVLHHMPIPNLTFSQAHELKEVVFECGTPTIGYNAFETCPELTSIKLLGPGFTSLSSPLATFTSISNDRVTITFSEFTNKQQYLNDTHWKQFIKQYGVKINYQKPRYKIVKLFPNMHSNELQLTDFDVVHSGDENIVTVDKAPKKLKANLVGKTSIVVTDLKKEQLYYVEVAGKNNSIVEPLLNFEYVDLENIKNYETKVAHRKLIKQDEVPKNGTIYYFASDSEPSIQARYHINRNNELQVIALDFKEEKDYKRVKAEEFYRERYKPIKIELYNQIIDAFLNPKGIRYTVTAVAENEVTIDYAPHYQESGKLLQVTLEKKGEGTIVIEGLKNNNNIPLGTVLKVIAKPQKGWALTKLTAMGNNIIETSMFTVTENTKVVAIFEPATCKVSYSSNSNQACIEAFIGTKKLTSGDKVPYGTTVTFKLVLDNKQQIKQHKGWFINGVEQKNTDGTTNKTLELKVEVQQDIEVLLSVILDALNFDVTLPYVRFVNSCIEIEGISGNELQLYTLNGKKVFSETLNNNGVINRLFVGNLPKGTYIVRIVTPRGVVTQKLIY